MESRKLIRIGIDASNLRQGGSRTHLIELLNNANQGIHNFDKIVIWGSKSTLELLENRDWLVKRNPTSLNGSLVRRAFWQKFELSKQLVVENCDALFVPGGVFSTKFRPVITMSRNMLPFELNQTKLYGISFLFIKNIFLRYTQSKSFKSANGVIFLTNYAKKTVETVIESKIINSVIIPHGLSSKFLFEPRNQRSIESYSILNPYIITYVSTIDFYKHHWNVVEAVGTLRRDRKWPLTLQLIGPHNKQAMKKLIATIKKWDPSNEWVHVYGSIKYQELQEYYKSTDLGLFASSCENMPNTLLEKMGAGIPIASSNYGPMYEILGDSGVYFNPYDSNDIANSLEILISDPNLRKKLALESYEKSKSYTWSKCADDTFSFINTVNVQFIEASKI